MKPPRNPVAGNSWRYNKPKIIKNKKKDTTRVWVDDFDLLDKFEGERR